MALLQYAGDTNKVTVITQSQVDTLQASNITANAGAYQMQYTGTAGELSWVFFDDGSAVEGGDLPCFIELPLEII
jgi:hypothetical protein